MLKDSMCVLGTGLVIADAVGGSRISYSLLTLASSRKILQKNSKAATALVIQYT